MNEQSPIDLERLARRSNVLLVSEQRPLRSEFMWVARTAMLDYSLRMQVFDLKPPPLTEDAHGIIRVTGTRVQFETVVAAFDGGATPEDIAQDYSTLDLPSVYAIIAYVLQNRPHVDAYMATRQTAADALRGDIERQFPQTGLRERLLRRRSGNAP